MLFWLSRKKEPFFSAVLFFCDISLIINVIYGTQKYTFCITFHIYSNKIWKHVSRQAIFCIHLAFQENFAMPTVPKRHFPFCVHLFYGLDQVIVNNSILVYSPVIDQG